MRLWFRRWLPALIGAGVLAGGLLSREPRELGAWFGAPEMRDPAAAVERAIACGLTRADVFVNDHGFADFALYDRAKIAALVRALQEAGLKVSLTTWARPQEDWIEGMREVGALADELGCDEVTLDLEEPWTLALSHTAAAIVREWTRRLFGALRASTRATVAVTCIVHASPFVLDVACELADRIIPQAYATATNADALRPGELERLAVKRYQRFGKPIILGQAAWNLVGAYGATSARQAITYSLRAARSLPIAGVRYWRIGWLFGEVAQTIRQEWRA